MTITNVGLAFAIVFFVYIIGVAKGRNAGLDAFSEAVTEAHIQVFANKTNELQKELAEHCCDECNEAVKDLFEQARVENADTKFSVK